MIFRINIILAFWLFVSFNSCKQDNGNQINSERPKVNFPNNFVNSSRENINENASKKVLIYLNADCSKCILHLDSWSQTAEELGSNISLELIVHGPSENLFSIWAKSLSFSHPYIWDTDNEFHQANLWLDNERSYFMLLDNQNHVLFSEDSYSDRELTKEDLLFYINEKQ